MKFTGKNITYYNIKGHQKSRPKPLSRKQQNFGKTKGVKLIPLPPLLQHV